MRKLVVAAALLSTVIATPAFADGPYVGIDAGTVKADRLKLRYITSAQSVDNGIVLRHKWGFDGDAVFGYDFGAFRLEGELGYKRSGLKNAALAPAALAGIFQPTTTTYFSADGHGSVWSGMANALADFGLGDGITASVGAGAGLARAKI